MFYLTHKIWSISTRTNKVIKVPWLLVLNQTAGAQSIQAVVSCQPLEMEQEGGPCWRTAGEIDQIDHTLISSSADFRRSDFLLDMMLLKFSDLHSRISIWIRKEKYTCDQNGVVYFTHLDLPGILNSERKGGKVRCHMPPWLYGQAGPWTRLWCRWLMSGSLERIDR